MTNQHGSVKFAEQALALDRDDPEYRIKLKFLFIDAFTAGVHEGLDRGYGDWRKALEIERDSREKYHAA